MTKISEMKKMTMICMAALLVMAMSCKKEKVENTAGGAGFRATLEAHAGDSKTHLEGLSVKWDDNDVVKVVNADNVVKTFKISEYAHCPCTTLFDLIFHFRWQKIDGVVF